MTQPRPNIWLEATHTLSRKAGRDGVGHYTEDVISSLATASPQQTYTVVGNVFAAESPQLPPLTSRNVRYKLSRWFPTKVWNQLFRYGLMPPLNWLIPGRPDVVVFFNFVRYPLSRGIKSIVTIHDLTFAHYPEQVRARNLSFLRKFVPRALSQADHIVAVSEYTKRDIHERYGTPLKNISVVPPGVDLELYRPDLNTTEVRQRLNLPEHYFLRVSTIEPRKNDLVLIEAYRALPAAVRRSHALVISGKVGWRDATVDRVLTEIARGDEVGRIIHTGYVSEADMPSLYAGATAFVLASHFEGFGMPALEAMACGTPVITSNTSSMPEVVGEAGIMVDPHDGAGFAAAMERLATKPDYRDELGRQGRQQAELFSWQHSAAKLQAVIDLVLAA